MGDAYCDATKDTEDKYIKCDVCGNMVYYKDNHWIHYINHRTIYFCENCMKDIIN